MLTLWGENNGTPAVFVDCALDALKDEALPRSSATTKQCDEVSRREDGTQGELLVRRELAVKFCRRSGQRRMRADAVSCGPNNLPLARNEYFAARPQMMLGKMAYAGSSIAATSQRFL